ncbi:NDP-hexose 2,3-dehydratase family protein [Streptomyces yaizuensis]|uniref:NDP-hexose 2,3-dehydratase family protein n=1 Tax=Streptomyces yaizuensis TaxID=2989713 RepID=UPI002B21366F|nr:NDP-hexose 2,3-dehydratase family protein [Streptomyces sp. YSPA8]
MRPRNDPSAARRFALSARTTKGAGPRTEDVPDWLDARAEAHHFRVEPIPFDRLDGWSFEDGTGNLVHRSGRFFTIEGLHVTRDEGPFREWRQPVIDQPEVGILGILVKEFDGVLHCLMQAKMEPGNPNLLQLSPTVQATRSNYTKVHGGAAVRYLEHFTDARPGQVVADVLQSEHGAWFLRKSNRNMIVETTEDVPLGDDFCWLTLGQLGELLRHDNVVNMDARTVLACAPIERDEDSALHSDTELRSWITAERSRHDVRVRRIPLADTDGWERGPHSIDRPDGRYFRVMAVSVQAASREVTSWTQPLVQPLGLGVTALLTRRFSGVPHVLVHARVEGGFLDTIELAPTVQCTPENYTSLTGADRPPFLDLVLGADPGQVRYEAVHSEEGGRFYHAESRYLIMDVDEEQAPADPPPGYRWVTPGQLSSLVRHGHYVNVQARSLLACLNTLAAPC